MSSSMPRPRHNEGRLSPYERELRHFSIDAKRYRSRAIFGGVGAVVGGMYVAHFLIGLLLFVLRVPQDAVKIPYYILLAAAAIWLCWLQFGRAIPRAFRRRRELVDELREFLVEGGVLWRFAAMDDGRAERDEREKSGSLGGSVAQAIRKSATPQQLLPRVFNFAMEALSEHPAFRQLAAQSATAPVLRSALQQALYEELGHSHAGGLRHPER